MQDYTIKGSILFVTAALLIWVAITTNVIIKDFTFVFVLLGLYMYAGSLWCKKRLLRRLAETAFFGWILAAGYFGELFARHLGWAFLTTSVTFLHADYYSTALNYYVIGYVPVFLLAGFLPLLAVILFPSSDPRPTKKSSSPQSVPVQTTSGAGASKVPVQACTICHKPGIYDICADCERTYKKEIQGVRTQNLRAKNAGEPATLTVVQWIQTLESYNWMCSYCQMAPYQCLEHYIPIGQGKLNGGTTELNCVPACHKCNLLKSNRHPEKGDRWSIPLWGTPAGRTAPKHT